MLGRLKKHLRRQVANSSRSNLVGRSMLFGYWVYNRFMSALSKSDRRSSAKLYIRAKNAERHLHTKGTIVTLEELFAWTTDWSRTFREDYDVIVGIPRAGLLIASIISLKLGKPLSTPELLGNGQYWMTAHANLDGDNIAHFRKVLLVDDDMCHGTSLERATEAISASNPHVEVTRAVLVASEETADKVDMYYKMLPYCAPIGEWKLLAWKRGVLAVDMDGVLCEDCPPEIELDEERYRGWLECARPHLIPNFKIEYIVSSRLEKYRLDTEDWLARHGVRYGELILWEIPSKADRDGGFAKHKIDVLLRIKPEEYWESEYQQAKAIWEATRIPTICIDEMVAFGPVQNW